MIAIWQIRIRGPAIPRGGSVAPDGVGLPGAVDGVSGARDQRRALRRRRTALRSPPAARATQGQGVDDSLRRRARAVSRGGRAPAPGGREVIDAHTHLGLDEDGRSLDLEQLLAQLDRAGARRACVFPLHDPERKPSYSVPNDRVLAWAARKRGPARAVLPPRPRRSPAGGGRTLPGGRRARHQAAPARAGLRLRRARDGRGLRAGRSGGGADPDPRRPRPAAAGGRARRISRCAIPARC